jgi:hypothetical protein
MRKQNGEKWKMLWAGGENLVWELAKFVDVEFWMIFK